MTREEAIPYLNVIWNRYKAEYEIERETLDAYHMAIEALTEETIEIKPMEIKGDFHIDDIDKNRRSIFEDIVWVVRCKDCRFAMVRTEEEMNKPIKPQPILCEWFCIGVENNDFCSHGERKEP